MGLLCLCLSTPLVGLIGRVYFHCLSTPIGGLLGPLQTIDVSVLCQSACQGRLYFVVFAFRWAACYGHYILSMSQYTAKRYARTLISYQRIITPQGGFSRGTYSVCVLVFFQSVRQGGFVFIFLVLRCAVCQGHYSLSMSYRSDKQFGSTGLFPSPQYSDVRFSRTIIF